MEESIYNIIPEEPQPPRRYKKYKSQFPGNIEPSYSTFGNHSNIIQVKNISGQFQVHSGRYVSEGGTIGRSRIQQLSPLRSKIMGTNKLEDWIEKGSLIKSMEDVHTHKMKLKPLVPRSTEKPLLGLQTNKNFIATNKIDVILKSPRQPHEQPNWLTKREYGQIPLYLSQIKDELKQSYLEEQSRAKELQQAEDNKLQLLQDEELQQIRAGLKQRYDEVNKQYQNFTHLKKFDTIGLKRKKEKFEKELVQLEKDMEKMNKNYVFVEK